MSNRGMILDDENNNNWGFKGTNYLLTIGIDQYQHWKPLKNAVKDATDFANLLKQSYQFEDDNITQVFNENATEKNILRTLKSFVSNITEEDNIIIYFSGHGHYDEELEEGYWVPVNAEYHEEDASGYIANQTLSSYLKKIKAHHTLLFIDSCFSGSILSGSRSGTRSEKFASFRIFASGRNEVVADGVAGQNSPFAASILEYLRANTKKALKTTTLIEEVKNMMEHRGAAQTPIDDRAGEFGDRGGEFIFYQKRSEEQIWNQLRKENTASGYKRYMEYFPNGIYAEQAEELAKKGKEDDIWKDAERSNAYAAFESYLQNYPGGKYHQQAREKLGFLKEKKAWSLACSANTVEAYEEYLKDFFDHPHAKEAEESILKIQKRMELSETASAERKARLEERITKEKSVAAVKKHYIQNFDKAEQLFANKKYGAAKIKYLECQKDYQKGFEPDGSFLKKRLDDATKYEQLADLYKKGKEAEGSSNYELAVHYYQKAYQVHQSPKLAQLIKNAKLKGGTAVARAPKKQSGGSAIGTILKVVGAAALGLIVLAFIGLLMEDGDEFTEGGDFNTSSTINDDFDTNEEDTYQEPAPAPTVFGQWTITHVATDYQDIPPLFVGAHYNFTNDILYENNIPLTYFLSGNQINVANSSVAGTVSFQGTNKMTISGMYVSTYPCVWTFERL